MLTACHKPRDYSIKIVDSKNPNYINRLIVATPTTGNIRMEWAQARYGQIIPVNWSMVMITQFMSGMIPYGYQVADAQNVIVRECVEGDYEWLLLIEHDTCPPPDAFIRFNEYMRECKTPVVSALYYTKSNPPEPLVFRGRGSSFYDRFKIGDKVWADGVPTGCLLIHGSILKTMWDESPEYQASNGQIVRRVFESPGATWFDSEAGQYKTFTGTSDLEWCSRIIRDHVFQKAGWPEYERKRWPFLVDTGILARHVDHNGVMYP